jgi:hypothetical protein
MFSQRTVKRGPPPGKNQSTIHRVMKAGRLSYTKDATGERKVDAAELERVFGPINAEAGISSRGKGASPGKDADPAHATMFGRRDAINPR